MIDFGLADVQNAGHGVTPRLYTRAPAGGSWVALNVVGSPTVTYARAGEFPGRTLAADVTLDAQDGRMVAQPADGATIDWLTAPLSPYGSWVAAEQLVTDQDGGTHVVPWGIYRLDSMTLHELTGTVTLSCSDVLSQIGERGLVTLAMGRVRPTDQIGTVMARMVNDALVGGIAPWWGSTFALDAGIPDRAYGSVNGKLFRDGRLDALTELGVNLTASNDPDRLAGGGLYAPRTTGPLAGWTTSGPAVKLIRRRNPARGTPEVSVARNLVAGDLDDQIDRANMFNEIVALWQASAVIDGSHTRTIQRRYLAQYTDAGEEVRGTGPFGWVTQDSVSIDIPSTVAPGGEDAYALQQARLAIENKFYATRELTVQSGPLYGLEQSDNVFLMIEDEGMAVLSCELTGATIPLGADGGPWQLQLQTTQLLDTWTPTYLRLPDDSTEVDGEFKWKTFTPNAGVTLDLTEGHGATATGGGRGWRGWTFTGADPAKVKGGSDLTLTSTGTTLSATTSQAWRVDQTHYRLRAWAKVMAVTDGQQFQVGIVSDLGEEVWGDWTTVKQGIRKDRTIVVEAPVPSSASTTFRVVVNVASMNVGGQARILSAGANYGALKR